MVRPAAISLLLGASNKLYSVLLKIYLFLSLSFGRSRKKVSSFHYFNNQDKEEDNMICKDIAMLGPLMLKQYNKLKVMYKTSPDLGKFNR